MLHALGYWRPTLATFPEAPPSTNTPKMRELQKSTPAEYDKVLAESRRATTEYNREFAHYDAEAMAAVDKFRTDKNLSYQGNPTGLVDARFVDALRAAYIQKRKGSTR
jgi:hypothetical protein